MSGQPPSMNIEKLRALIRRRNEAVNAARELTDRFLHLRSEVGRFKEIVSAQRRDAGPPNQGSELQLAQLQEQLRQVEADRESVQRRLEGLSFVDRLIDYARDQGLVVDEVAATVTNRPKRDPKRDPRWFGEDRR